MAKALDASPLDGHARPATWRSSLACGSPHPRRQRISQPQPPAIQGLDLKPGPPLHGFHPRDEASRGCRARHRPRRPSTAWTAIISREGSATASKLSPPLPDATSAMARSAALPTWLYAAGRLRDLATSGRVGYLRLLSCCRATPSVHKIMRPSRANPLDLDARN